VTLLPFLPMDIVRWCDGDPAQVLEVRGERIVVETVDGVLHITSETALRAMQRNERGAA
jgi:hypothetical protein